MNHSNSVNSELDVLIVGAGMVGLALAASLSQTSLRVGLVEAKTVGQKAAQDDGRASAIAQGSVQILEKMGAWQPMQTLGVSPIHQIKISDEGYPWITTLRRQEIGSEALGYVIENWVTEQALQQVISQSGKVQWFRPAKVEAIAHHPTHIQATITQSNGEPTLISTQLLVGADGRQSQVRQWANIPVTGWAYDQVLLVCIITTEQPHQQTGYERFHASGPFAVLPMVPPPQAPMAHRCCIVWTVQTRDRTELMKLDDQTFMAAMSPRIPSELGQILSVSSRFCYAPRRQNADCYVGDRLVLVGDAAHATHPVGGQGLNMGLRDVATLSSLLAQATIQGQDLGNPNLLQSYQRRRRVDNETVLLGTDLANRLFSNDWIPLQGLRRLGLWTLDQVLPVKQLLMQYAMGLTPVQRSD